MRAVIAVAVLIAAVLALSTRAAGASEFGQGAETTTVGGGYDSAPNLALVTVADAGRSGVVDRRSAGASGPSLARSSRLVAPGAAGWSSWWRRALADETGSISIGRYTPDEQALVELAKDARRTGVDLDDADSLLDWADELGFNSHGPMTHPNRSGFWSQTLHIKIGHYHIGVIE